MVAPAGSENGLSAAVLLNACLQETSRWEHLKARRYNVKLDFPALILISSKMPRKSAAFKSGSNTVILIPIKKSVCCEKYMEKIGIRR